MASHDAIRDVSLYGNPPLWTLEIRPVSGEISIQVQPELLWFAENRRVIDELGDALQLRLHALTNSQMEVIERLQADSGGRDLVAALAQRVPR